MAHRVPIVRRRTDAADGLCDYSEDEAPQDRGRGMRGTLCGLDWLNFFLAGVQTGVEPIFAIYLARNGWNEQLVGIAMTVGGIAGIFAQAPAGALVDRLHAKRLLVGALAVHARATRGLSRHASACPAEVISP